MATNQVFPDGGDINDPALNDAYAFDMDKAKELLADAGYPDASTSRCRCPRSSSGRQRCGRGHQPGLPGRRRHQRPRAQRCLRVRH
ncbi:hypothetical protein CTI14_63760, partial [Methylobacterium radiotolerans]